MWDQSAYTPLTSINTSVSFFSQPLIGPQAGISINIAGSFYASPRFNNSAVTSHILQGVGFYYDGGTTSPGTFDESYGILCKRAIRWTLKSRRFFSW